MILSLMTLATPAARADDWPMPRHDAANTGRSAAEVAPPLRLAWRARAYAWTYPFLLASGGVVAAGRQQAGVGERAETLLIGQAGEALWRVPGGIPVYLKGDTLVVAAGDDETDAEIRCYDRRRRGLRWSLPLGGRLYRWMGAVERGGVLYCSCVLRPFVVKTLSYGTPYAALKALALADGSLVAERSGEPEGWGEGPPAHDGQYLYWGVRHWLHVLEPRTLGARWAWYGGGNAYPLAFQCLVAAQGWGHNVGVWRKEDRAPAWNTAAWRSAGHCLAPGGGGRWLLVEAIPSPPAVAAFDLETGEKAWQRPLWVGGPSAGTEGGLAASAGRFVYVPGWHENLPGQEEPRGGFYAFDAATGRERWRFEEPGLRGVAVAPAAGGLYGLGSDGMVYRFLATGR